MAFFKMVAGDTTYEIEKLTLGDSRILKHHFGVSDLEDMSATDPDVVTGLLAISIRRANPGLTIEQASAQADALSFDDFDTAEDEKEVAAPLAQAPVAEDASAATVAPESSGSLETTPEASGPQA